MTPSATSTPPLVLAAHGSPHPAHRPAVEALRDAVAAVPGRRLDVRIGWIDFFEPGLAAATAAAAQGAARGGAAAGASVVVVPLLLASGYHATVDVPGLVADVSGVEVADVLGPHPLLAAALRQRLAESGAAAGDAVVLAAAGSSDDGARSQVEEVAAMMAADGPRAVRVAYAAGRGPRVGEAVAGLRADGHTGVAVATYLLSPGALAARIADEAAEAGVRTVAAPLGSAPEVVELVLLRWAAAVSRASAG